MCSTRRARAQRFFTCEVQHLALLTPIPAGLTERTWIVVYKNVIRTARTRVKATCCTYTRLYTTEVQQLTFITPSPVMLTGRASVKEVVATTVRRMLTSYSADPSIPASSKVHALTL